MFEDAPVTLVVQDLSGRIIHESKLQGKEGINDLMLDLTTATAGTYFLKFLDDYGSTMSQSRISIK